MTPHPHRPHPYALIMKLLSAGTACRGDNFMIDGGGRS